MTEDVLVPGTRDVRASLDGPDGAVACVVACPPHPQHGGSRSDERLRAVDDALGERGVACVRFDYGPWAEGRGERADAERVIAWARERYDRVGLFGYSFGAAVALVVAAGDDELDGHDLCAVSVLAPPARSASLDALAAVASIDAPLQVCHGERDDTVDWRSVVDSALEAGATVEAFPADHFFVGASDRIGETVAGFLAERCR